MPYGILRAAPALIYPFYASYKTLSNPTPDIGELKKWCTYWSTLSLILLFETLPPTSFIPPYLSILYSIPRIVLTIYLLLPPLRFGGAEWIFRALIQPCVSPYEAKIDEAIANAKRKFWDQAGKLAWKKVFAKLKAWTMLPDEIWNLPPLGVVGGVLGGVGKPVIGVVSGVGTGVVKGVGTAGSGIAGGLGAVGSGVAEGVGGVVPIAGVIPGTGDAKEKSGEVQPAPPEAAFIPSPFLILQQMWAIYTPLIFAIFKSLTSRGVSAASTTATSSASSLTSTITSPLKNLSNYSPLKVFSSPGSATKKKKNGSPKPRELDLRNALASSPGSGISTVATASPSPTEIRARILAKKRDEAWAAAADGVGGLANATKYVGSGLSSGTTSGLSRTSGLASHVTTGPQSGSGEEDSSLTGSRYERIERDELDDVRPAYERAGSQGPGAGGYERAGSQGPPPFERAGSQGPSGYERAGGVGLSQVGDGVDHVVGGVGALGNTVGGALGGLGGMGLGTRNRRRQSDNREAE